LLTDRVEFKLLAAQMHLNKLQEIKIDQLNVDKVDPRVPLEFEIDCFLSQILGAVDCLLMLINTRLDLGISIEKVDLATIQSALNAGTKNIGLLTELREALEHNSWLWILREFRNQAMQRPSKEVQDFLFEDRATSTSSRDQDKSTGNYDEYINKNLVAYFERSLGRVRELIDIIRMKESLLK
ncbi:MAG: hypothetical protein WCE92_10775, partial [Nitrososphaeraceae archaeon]